MAANSASSLSSLSSLAPSHTVKLETGSTSLPSQTSRLQPLRASTLSGDKRPSPPALAAGGPSDGAPKQHQLQGPGQQPPPPASLPPRDPMAMSAVISPDPTAAPARLSMTTKEWVIPPRPKPGRKPATDTPPTKRKAQNRAAQRAFRERRAARVGELEELLDQQRDAHVQEESDLKGRIRELELELQSFRSRCSLLESMLERERQDRTRAESQVESITRRNYHTRPLEADANPSLHPHLDIRQDSPARYQHEHLHHHPTDRTHDTRHSLPEADETLPPDCAKCTFGPECKCLNDVAEAFSKPQVMKRSASPDPLPPAEKRHRANRIASNGDETDFTSSFSRQPAAHTTQQPQAQISPVSEVDHATESVDFKDSCGFCNQGSYCVCAEDAQLPRQPLDQANALPPIINQIQTPPPSEADVGNGPMSMEMTADGAVKLPPRTRRPKTQPAVVPQDTAKGCGPNGPGTCAQCQADPKSGLFCRLMAASINRGDGSPASGCCGGKGADGGCCKGPAKKNITLPSLPSLGLSCADAYQTLSSHRNFERAADDISSWLPKLKTTAREAGTVGQTGRIPMEVEAASIMSVLKDFDVRFGAS